MAEFRLETAVRRPEAERNAILAAPGFGSNFSDHMVVIDWDRERGWHDHRITGYAPFTLDPASAVFHYAQEAFEGLKAYAHADGSLWRFRAEVNAARFQRSARRLALPELSTGDFLAGIDRLVEVDRDWVPRGAEQSLYLRPFMFAHSAFLAVKPSATVTYAVIASPSGAYFGGSGVQPVKIWVSRDFSRAAPGGTGFAKCGGNYAASLAAANEAAAHGCGQVLYLDGAEHRWLEECGTMNFMMITAGGQLVTPALGSILDGITRDSLLTLAGEHGLEAVERPISIDELRDGIASGQVTETFACGTAAVITPITGFDSPEHGAQVVGDGEPGEKTGRLRAHLLDIQYGRAEDRHGWMHRVA